MVNSFRLPHFRDHTSSVCSPMTFALLKFRKWCMSTGISDAPVDTHHNSRRKSNRLSLGVICRSTEINSREIGELTTSIAQAVTFHCLQYIRLLAIKLKLPGYYRSRRELAENEVAKCLCSKNLSFLNLLFLQGRI